MTTLTYSRCLKSFSVRTTAQVTICLPNAAQEIFKKIVYGHNLLVLCSSLDLHIFNGACEGDKDGQYTCISAASNKLLTIFFAQSVYRSKMKVLVRIDSKHMVITYFAN